MHTPQMTHEARTCTLCNKAYSRAPEETSLAFCKRHLCPPCAQDKEPVPVNVCVQCGGTFTQRTAEGREAFRRRKYCSRTCGSRGSLALRVQALKRTHAAKRLS